MINMYMCVNIIVLFLVTINIEEMRNTASIPIGRLCLLHQDFLVHCTEKNMKDGWFCNRLSCCALYRGKIREFQITVVNTKDAIWSQ